MGECFVYIMKSGNKRGPIKIGVANNPEQRISMLQTGNPYPIQLLAKIPMPSRAAAYDLESWMHEQFDLARMEGEWFDSKRCNIKMALDAYPGKACSDSRAGVRSLRVFGFKDRGKLNKLKGQNQDLRIKVSQLESAIEEMLDSQIDMSHI